MQFPAKLAKDASAKHSAKEHVKNAVSLAKMLRRRTDQERDERERKASARFGQDLINNHDYFYEMEDDRNDDDDDDDYDAKDQKLVFRDGVLVTH